MAVGTACVVTDETGRIQAAVVSVVQSGTGGFTVEERQRLEAEEMAWCAVVDAHCSEAIASALKPEKYLLRGAMERRLRERGWKMDFKTFEFQGEA